MPRPGIVTLIGRPEELPLLVAGTRDKSISAGNVAYRYEASRATALAAVCSYVN